MLPPAVAAGAKVAVCTPSSPVPEDRLRAGLEVLEQHYRVVVDPRALTATGYLAGDDDRRAEEINGYLRDPDVRAIIMGRGGYGLMRILPQLDADALRRDPKVLVGFSDGTALLCWAHRVAGVRGIHGPVVAQLGELSGDDVEWLVQMMGRTEPMGGLTWRLAAIGATATAGRIEGELVGGNLCILSHLVGTPYQVDLADRILMFEDIGERPYKLDRYLTHLGLAGALDGVRGALVGDLTGCDHDVDGRGLDVIAERLRHYGIAGVRNTPFGHGKRNASLPFGARCEVDVAAGKLYLLDAAVA